MNRVPLLRKPLKQGILIKSFPAIATLYLIFKKIGSSSESVKIPKSGEFRSRDRGGQSCGPLRPI